MRLSSLRRSVAPMTFQSSAFQMPKAGNSLSVSFEQQDSSGQFLQPKRLAETNL